MSMARRSRRRASWAMSAKSAALKLRTGTALATVGRSDRPPQLYNLAHVQQQAINVHAGMLKFLKAVEVGCNLPLVQHQHRLHHRHRRQGCSLLSLP